MAFGKPYEGEGEALSEINMIPLIDVMLVLLIVFIITVPVIQHVARVDLPQASSQPAKEKAERVRIAIDASGAYFWGETPIEEAALIQRLQDSALATPQPEVYLHGDQTVPYGKVAAVIAAAQKSGILKLGFVTTP